MKNASRQSQPPRRRLIPASEGPEDRAKVRAARSRKKEVRAGAAARAKDDRRRRAQGSNPIAAEARACPAVSKASRGDRR